MITCTPTVLQQFNDDRTGFVFLPIWVLTENGKSSVCSLNTTPLPTAKEAFIYAAKNAFMQWAVEGDRWSVDLPVDADVCFEGLSLLLPG